METHIEFTTEAIVIPAANGAAGETGAEVEFRGIVRETEHGRAIAGLTYEAHLPMAGRQLRRILEQLSKTWHCQAVWFIHRIGWVPAGEASLYIRVRASHREPAFRLCMELIDLLKADVPIWKLTPPDGAEAASPRGS
jgi:molybdopterin synthase catalytic subunit